jgi:hypothetical protein
MRFRKQNLAVLFVLISAALLAIPAVSSLRLRTVSAVVQDTSRSDAKVAAKNKQSTPHTPQGQGAAPVNDNCANAISINACPFSDTQDTTGATNEAGEPASTCTIQSNSVWYTLPAIANTRTVSLDTCGSAPVDTAVMVYRVGGAECDFAQFVAVACNDDFCGDGLQSTVNFTADPGQTYKIQVGGFAGDTGVITTNVSCQEILCDNIVINGTLGSGDPNFPGPQTSGNVVGRLNRNGISSTCDAPKACLIFDPANNRAFDAYSIPNESGEDACVSVSLSETADQTCNLQSNAYLGAFVPGSICTNYLADPGLSTGVPPTPTNMSFIVPAGATLVVVVMTTNPGETGCTYTVTVTGNLCEQFDFCIQDDNNPFRFIKINSTTGAYEFTDCSKGIVFGGTGVVSQSFCKITLTDRGPNPKRPDRSINVLVNPCTGRGDASVRPPGTFNTTIIGDSNVFNNTCECPTNPPPPPRR